MQKISIRIILGMLLLFSMSMTLIAQPPRGGEVITGDEIELVILENGDQVEDALLGGMGANLYVFNGSRGDVVRINMTQAPESELDPYLILLGDSGEVLAVDDDGGPSARDAEINNFELPDDGSYLIVATTYNSRRQQPRLEDLDDEDEQFFEIRLSGNNAPPEFEDFGFELFVDQVDIGDIFRLELTEREPIAIVAVELLEGDVVSFDALSREVDTLIYLFDPFGSRLAVNDDRATGNYSARVDTFEAEEDGFYLVFVTVFNYYDALTSNLTLGEVDFSIE